mgnify:CR=1 FL=1
MNELNPEEQPKTEEPANYPQQMDQTQRSHAPAEVGKWTSKIKEWWFQLKKFSRECRRVMKVTQKPNKEEFLTIAKVSALGLTIIGLIGFALSMIQQLIL